MSAEGGALPWPIIGVKTKDGEWYYHDTEGGNHYNTGDGWLVVLPWGVKRKRGGFHADNRCCIEHDDIEQIVILNERTPSPEVQRVLEAAKAADLDGFGVKSCRKLMEAVEALAAREKKA